MPPQVAPAVQEQLTIHCIIGIFCQLLSEITRNDASRLSGKCCAECDDNDDDNNNDEREGREEGSLEAR